MSVATNLGRMVTYHGAPSLKVARPFGQVFLLPTITMLIATKLSRMVTYYERLLSIKSLGTLSMLSYKIT